MIEKVINLDNDDLEKIAIFFLIFVEIFTGDKFSIYVRSSILSMLKSNYKIGK